MENFFDIETPRMQHAMADIETMSNKPNAAIIAIGAVTFDIKSLSIGQTFYTTVDLESCAEHGLHLDASTIKCWMEQSDQARRDVLTGAQLPLPVALLDFRDWLDQHTVERKNRCIWGNGASFDPVILESAYRACKIETPWEFWGSRCFRTLKNLYANVEAPPRQGTHHNALDDAMYQVEWLFKIRKTLRGEA